MSSRRLLFPIVPVLIPPALDVLRGFLPAAARGVRVPRGVALASAALLAAGGITLAAAAGPPDADRHIRPVSTELTRSLPEGSAGRILVRPSRTIPPDWMFPRGTRLVGLPASVPDASAGNWIRANSDQVLLSEGLVRNRPAVFGGYVDFTVPDSRLVPGLDVRAGVTTFVDLQGRPVYVLMPSFRFAAR